MTKNLCILPWIHMEISATGEVKPCCLYNGFLKDDNKKPINLSTSSFSDAWNSKDLKELRQRFLRGEKPEKCSRCWEVEAVGKKSKRQTSNERFSHHLQNLDEENISLAYLDLKLGTLCNLKCRTCSTESSSRWYTDEVKLFGKALNSKTKGYWPESNTFWTELEETIPSLEFIDFAGGEPLLLTRHFDFLHKCVKMDAAKNISIHYNTNGTIPITDEMIELWSNFKWVEIMFSLDGIEKRFEYIRHPANWDKVRENFESLLPHKNLHLTICYTFSILNVLYLKEFFDWKNSYDREIEVYLNPIYSPTHYNIKALSKLSKEKISNVLNQINDKKIQQVIDFMMSEHLKSLEYKFLQLTADLDQIRGESFFKLFPELNNILKANITKNKKPAEGNKTFCMAPWTHTYISPQSERRLCCASREEPSWQKQYIDSGSASSSSYQPITLNEHWNSDHMKSVRKRMLAGETLPECQICNENILNLHTYRQYFTETLFPHCIDEAFANTTDDGETTMLPISFDYRINNLCNFKCRMCGEQLSSSWETEKRLTNAWSPERDPWMIPDNKKQIQKFQKEVVEKELWNAVYNKTVEEIYWVGGEPLMWDIHWDIMEYLVKNDQAKNVTIRYNTNLSRINYKDRKLYDLLPYFLHINLCASIDATGEIGEYIRTGLNWEQWLQNFKDGLFLIEQFGNDSIVLDVTLTTPGMFDMKNMFDLALELDVKTYLKITFAFDPAVLMSPMAMSREALDEVLDDLIAYCEPKVTWKTKVYIDTFKDMKTRLTFAEQWPDKYQEGFQNGKKRLERISSYRNDTFKMEDILTNKALEWWNQ